MKKVLFFIPNLSVGGAEKVLVNTVNNLNRDLFDVTVQVLFAGGVNEQFLKKDVKFNSCFKKSFKGNSRILTLFKPETLFKRFIREKYDIIVSYLEGPTARITAGCLDRDTKLVCWIHCRFDSQKTASVGFRDFNEAKQSFNRFDRIICVSQLVKKHFCNIVSPEKEPEVLYNITEVEDVYCKSHLPVEDVVFDRNCFLLCSVGKIEPVKGYDRLARVHKRLADAGIKNKVYILGNGSQKGEITAYLKQNHLEDSFIFLGYKTNPYKYVSKCDLFVCSSISEGFSTAVTESLIVGTPVCTVEVSGMKEMLGDNNEYGIVTENSEDALYEGIVGLLNDPSLLSHYRRQAEIRGREFNTKNTVRAVEEMLSQL